MTTPTPSHIEEVARSMACRIAIYRGSPCVEHEHKSTPNKWMCTACREDLIAGGIAAELASADIQAKLRPRPTPEEIEAVFEDYSDDFWEDCGSTKGLSLLGFKAAIHALHGQEEGEG